MYNLPEMRADNARFGEALRELLRAHDWGLITVEFSEREDGIFNNDNVFLIDGYIHVAVIKTKGEEAPDMGAHGSHFTGIHHFGFEVDDLDEAGRKLEAAHGHRLTAKD